MTKEQYLAIKVKLGALMYELEGVPSDEQRVPVGRDTIVELLSDFWREVNRSMNRNGSVGNDRI